MLAGHRAQAVSVSALRNDRYQCCADFIEALTAPIKAELPKIKPKERHSKSAVTDSKPQARDVRPTTTAENSSEGTIPLLSRDDEPTSPRRSKWLSIAGILLMIAGWGALLEVVKGVQFIIPACFLFVSGGSLLPIIWDAVIRRCPYLAPYSTPIRWLLFLLTLFAVGVVSPSR